MTSSHESLYKSNVYLSHIYRKVQFKCHTPAPAGFNRVDLQYDLKVTLSILSLFA